MSIEIVSHCWRYTRLLTYQLSSLFSNPPVTVEVLMTVFLTESDEPTVRVMDFFEQHATPQNIRVRRWTLPQKELMQRAIGRNLAAKATVADWVWLADCDYYFGEGALDAIPDAFASKRTELLYPKRIYGTDHPTGDRLIEDASGEPRLLTINPDDFTPLKYSRAIGGVQIVRGDTLRTKGYCSGSKLLKRRPGKWRDTVGDVHFRRTLNSRGVKAPIPNVFRIRHSQRGGDVRL